METKKLNQPLNGVLFNEKESTATFTIKYCSKEEYIYTIRALLAYVGSNENGICDKNERFFVCNLISSMLPDEKQIINL